MYRKGSRLTKGIYTAALPSIILSLYAIGLVGVLYATYRINENENIANFHLNTRRQADTIAYFLKERHQEINRLAQNPFILAYFQNEALGVELGLIQNRLAIMNEFDLLLKQKSYIDGSAIYSQILLFGKEGELVTHISRIPGQPLPLTEVAANSATFSSTIFPSKSPEILVLAAPSRIRGKTVGWLAATISWKDILTHLLNEFNRDLNDNHKECKKTVAIYYKGALLYAFGCDKIEPEIFEKIYADYLRPEYPENCFLIKSNENTFLPSVYPVKLTPFCLARIYPKCHITHIYRINLIFWLLLIFLALLLCWMFWAFKKGVQTVSLKYEVKEAEALAQSKSEFLSTMSHEIRTPLNGLLGALFLIEKKEVSGDAKQLLDIALKSGQRLMTLIDEILQLARIEGEQPLIREQNFSPERLVEDVINLSTGLMQGKDVNLYMFVDCPERIIGDEAKMAQILINLVSNAIKFTEKGWIKITVQCACSGPDQYIKFTVEDTGCGIPKTVQEKIFNAFEQGTDSSYTALKGTGLGLTIIKKITDVLGGKLELSSAENRGTCFSVWVPVQCTKEHKPLSVGTPAKTCLVLMEDKILQQIVDKYLKRWHLHVIIGNFKVRNLKKHFSSVDIIITDSTNKYFSLLGKCFKPMAKAMSKKVIEILPTGVTKSQAPHDDQLICTIKSPVKFSNLYSCIFDQEIKKDDSYTTENAKLSNKLRCLLVEDNQLNQMITSTMLNKIGIKKVDIAPGGEEALNYIRSGNRYNLILMDCRMPGMDGFVTTKKIRELEKELGFSRTPVIALTAQVMDDIKEKCIKADMDVYLSKPVTPEKLFTTINNLTHKKTPARNSTI